LNSRPANQTRSPRMTTCPLTAGAAGAGKDLEKRGDSTAK
jgi:hypothetical protein